MYVDETYSQCNRIGDKLQNAATSTRSAGHVNTVTVRHIDVVTNVVTQVSITYYTFLLANIIKLIILLC